MLQLTYANWLFLMLEFWRREGDSNSRSRFPQTNDLANRPLQPLGYPSNVPIISYFTLLDQIEFCYSLGPNLCYNRENNCERKMNKLLKTTTQIATGVIAFLTLSAGRVMALSVKDGAEAARADGMPADLIGPNGVFTQITNTVLYVVGIISVVMLIYGGLRYVISGGDSKKVTDAKNTILYAIIGLIISILAFAIVNFVINAITGESDSAASPDHIQESSESQ